MAIEMNTQPGFQAQIIKPTGDSAENPGASDAQPSQVSEPVVPPSPPDVQLNDKHIINPEDIKKAVDRLNSMMSDQNRNIQFVVDPGTGKDVIRVTDSSTGKVVRQLPTVEMLKASNNLNSMIGILFDDKS